MKKEYITKAKKAYLNSFTGNKLDYQKIKKEVAKIISYKPSEVLPILKFYKKLLVKKLLSQNAIVTTADEINPKLKEEISQKLRHLFADVSTVEFNKNKNILGGVKIQVGDQVYDSSIEAKLKLLEEIDE